MVNLFTLFHNPIWPHSNKLFFQVLKLGFHVSSSSWPHDRPFESNWQSRVVPNKVASEQKTSHPKGRGASCLLNVHVSRVYRGGGWRALNHACFPSGWLKPGLITTAKSPASVQPLWACESQHVLFFFGRLWLNVDGLCCTQLLVA